MAALRRLYGIGNFRIGTTSKGSDIQHISLWIIWRGDQVLCITSHWEKIIYLHLGLGSWGNNLEYFLAWNNSAKIENLEKSFYGPKYPPLENLWLKY